MTVYIIDRLEGDWAIVETDSRETFNLPRILIPNAKEGDVIQIIVTVDQAATVKRHDEANKMLDNFFDE